MTIVPFTVLPHGADLPPPERATAGAAGFDLRAAVGRATELLPGAVLAVPCGLALAIPAGWEGQVRPRSGLALKHAVTVINAPGTIDSDYRGEILVPLVNLGREPFVIERGMRIAQIVFALVPEVSLDRVESLPADTARGRSGFGSTGTS